MSSCGGFDSAIFNCLVVCHIPTTHHHPHHPHLISSQYPVLFSSEQPVFTSRAHVFQIDAATKKHWVKISSQAIPVSFYHDSARSSHRIISVDGSKALINSSISPTMSFQKTSAKFGQWTDLRAATVYGLGFGSPEELEKVGSCARLYELLSCLIALN